MNFLVKKTWFVTFSVIRKGITEISAHAVKHTSVLDKKASAKRNKVLVMGGLACSIMTKMFLHESILQVSWDKFLKI